VTTLALQGVRQQIHAQNVATRKADAHRSNARGVLNQLPGNAAGWTGATMDDSVDSGASDSSSIYDTSGGYDASYDTSGADVAYADPLNPSDANPLGDASTFDPNFDPTNGGNADTSGQLSDTSTGTGSPKDNSNVDPTADPGQKTATGAGQGSNSPGTGMTIGKPPTPPRAGSTGGVGAGQGGGAPNLGSGPQSPTSSTQPTPRPSYLPPNPRYIARPPSAAAVDPRGLGGSYPVTNSQANVGWQPTGPGVTTPSVTSLFSGMTGAPGGGGALNPQLLLYGAIALALFALVKH
jgi:hypothetical protein